jgi:hypothetical protein
VVNSLFAKQPFRAHPPRYVRRFAEASQRGSYWKRELLGEYLRPLSLEDPAFRAYLQEHGFEAPLVPDRI